MTPWLRRLFGRDDAGTVSRACLAHHARHETTRGVDLPTWRSPKELNAMRRAERKAALRVVRKTA